MRRVVVGLELVDPDARDERVVGTALDPAHGVLGQVGPARRAVDRGVGRSSATSFRSADVIASVGLGVGDGVTAGEGATVGEGTGVTAGVLGTAEADAIGVGDGDAGLVAAQAATSTRIAGRSRAAGRIEGDLGWFGRRWGGATDTLGWMSTLRHETHDHSQTWTNVAHPGRP